MAALKEDRVNLISLLSMLVKAVGLRKVLMQSSAGDKSVNTQAENLKKWICIEPSASIEGDMIRVKFKGADCS